MIRFLIVLPLLLAVFQSCKQKKVDTHPHFSYDPAGYYFQLLSFEDENRPNNSDKVFWVAASFKTQSDSVFWDSFNNLNDKFYVESDSLQRDNLLRYSISQCSELDSACVLIKTRDFFLQQFKTTSVPFFSEKDSVVKINFSIKRTLSKEEFIRIKHDLLAQEDAQIKRYFGTRAEMEAAQDPLGFYWIDRNEGTGNQTPHEGDQVAISYQGEYLTGRFLEKSPEKFEFIVGTPDQLLKGLNYVISRLKLAGNAKIILPSHLAFGESGSSNGMVPPYTPLVYKIEILEHKINTDLTHQERKARTKNIKNKTKKNR